MKLWLNDWQIGTFFGMQAVAGYDQDGRRIVRPYYWRAGGIVGTVNGESQTVDYRLGRPGAGEPSWLTFEAHREYVRTRPRRVRPATND